ncbi:MAG: DUF6508 domain-containing protein [Actinomycetia bacterium]|nr:DUF6508 domain-containing protein [Actinomycetes bacterium]
MIADADYIPSVEQIDSVLRFLPILEREDFVPSTIDPGDLLYPHVFAPELSEFEKTLYDSGFIFSYDWGAWQDEAVRYYQEPESLGGADLQTLRKLLTLHVRKERFCNGHLPAMIEHGHITAILRRLKDLRDTYPNGSSSGASNRTRNGDRVSYRGSRKHVLDWTGRPSFLEELRAFLAPIPVYFSADAKYMPCGENAPDEARLETFGPQCLPGRDWDCLRRWWLRHEKGANTPNWDIAVACKIEGKPGLVLVEAKAHWKELSRAGKRLDKDASDNTRENHDRICAAIEEACEGWRRIDKRVSITHRSHYQLANRLAFTWKLAKLGIPVVLLYLGFTGDEGIRDVGPPFADEGDWRKAFAEHIEGVVPFELFDGQRKGESTPVWLVLRSRPVI